MLASSLISRFIVSPSSPSGRYIILYREHYAPDATATLPETCPPPGASLTHARTMATTLVEWAARLDAAGVQVHQEGAIARFLGSAQAPDFGRNVGAVGARRKTVGFYAAVLKAAVGQSHARTYLIPASSWQGASVALTEAQASAAAFHAARAALDAPAQTWPTDRPELAHLAAQAPAQDRTTLEREAGRAAAMHQTAMAEALGCLVVAESGPWFRQVSTPADLPTGCLVVGVEVFPGPLLGALAANLDPQHGGGTFGLGCQPAGAIAACDAAIQIVSSLGGPLPASTRYVTPRVDPDALVAAMILSGRIPLAIAAGDLSIRELADFDSSSTGGLAWVPSAAVEPQTVSDSPRWGAVGQMCLAFVRGGEGAPTLAHLEAAVWSAIGAPETLGYRAQKVQVEQQLQRAQGLIAQVQVAGPIGLGVEFPMGAGTFGAVYARAPIAILVTDRFPFRGQSPGRKFTVACHRGVAQGAEFHRAFRRLIASAEQGWGGAETITGSPMTGPSRLTAEQVVAFARDAAGEVGIMGATRFAAPATLR
jgi:hypothetical protein